MHFFKPNPMTYRKYNEEVNHAASTEEVTIPPALFDAMYELFVQIGVFWQNMEHPEAHRTGLLTFMNNRISVDPTYLYEYKNAAEVIEELTYEYGKDKAYEILFTDPTALYNPPQTRLARARQKVSNEFITFQLSAGGFKAYGAKNWPGYIAGGNIPGDTPYRTAKEQQP